MTRSMIEERLAQHRAAFERRDPDALAETHAPDGSFESPAVGIVEGRDAIRGVYRYWYEAFPGFAFVWDRPLIDPPRASFLWSFSGTAAGPFFGEAKPGSSVTMRGAAEYVFGEDGIVSARHVFDFSGALVRAGVLKIKPS